MVQVWRHPVKSMQGEQLDSAHLTPYGVAGDRTWAVRDLATGAVLSAKREPRLLMAAARSVGDGVAVTLPDGSVFDAGPAADAALTAWLGRAVRLERTPHGGLGFVDAAPVHIVTTGTLAAMLAEHPAGEWDPRRFRPNLVVAAGPGPVEDSWVGRDVAVGGLVMAVTERTRRCSMTAAAQSGLGKDLLVLATLARVHGVDLGVYAEPLGAGVVQVGAVVTPR